METHYTTLGVAENASQEEIKAAYRKLAMKYHPDRNPGDAAAEEQFKKINTAYAEVGEPDARSKYDQMRQFGGGQGHPFGQNGFEFNFGFGGGGFEDIINQFFHQNGFGHPHAQRQHRNRDFTFNLHLSLEEAFTGKQTPVQFNVNGQDYNLTVNIPAGIDNGTRIRYAGHGDKSIPNVPAGDLYINVLVLEHPRFHRNGPHLLSTVQVDAIEACVGSEFDFECIDGQKVRVTVPEGTQPGSQIRLRERGMPVRAGGHPRGDLIITMDVKIPTNLSEVDKQELKNILNRRKA